MSVTFWCPDAPTRIVYPYPDEPDYAEHQSLLPEINLANANARAALEMMNLPDEDLCGSLEVEQFDAVLETLHTFVATPVQRAALIEPDTVDGNCVGYLPVHPRPALDFTPTSLSDPGAMTLGQLLSAKLSADAESQVVQNAPAPTMQMLLAESKRGPRMVGFGRSDEYLVATAHRFISLLTQAKESGYRVSWG